MSADSYLLPSLDKALSEGGRVNWKCLNKLINFINTNDGFTPELHYSLKSRLKLKDTQKVLNTLTVYYTISINVKESVREDMTTRMKLGKIFLRNKSDIVRHAILQLLSDWAFMFGNQALGRYSVVTLREIYNKYGMTIRPTARAAEIYETIRRSEHTHLLKGFEFENRPDQISINCEKSRRKVTLSCTSHLTAGSLKLGSVKKLFGRSEKNIPKKATLFSTKKQVEEKLPVGSAVLCVPLIRGVRQENEKQVLELLVGVSRACKNLRDLLSDVRVLMDRGEMEDVHSKMNAAEQLRNKCASKRNRLQYVISASTGGTANENKIKPELVPKLIQAEQRLDKDGEDTDEEATGGMEDWVDFSSPSESESEAGVRVSGVGSPLASGLVRAESLESSQVSKQSQFQRPFSSMGYRIPLPKAPMSSDPGRPGVMAVQSPFADAGELIEAARAAQMSRRRNTTIDPIEEEYVPRRSQSFSEERLVKSSAQSFTDRLRSGSKSTMCPALKVRFTDKHLEDVLSRLGFS